MNPENTNQVVSWRSPSNIALIKYWGKKINQIPCNPSLSYTLSNSYTDTTVAYRPSDKNAVSLDFVFEKKKNKHFEEKVFQFLTGVTDIFPFLNHLHLDIQSSNSFPHSSGIASSASSMSALALCLCNIEQNVRKTSYNEDEFFQRASYVARSGSGSAARSVYGGVVLWGKLEGFSTSSDKFAVPLKSNIAPVFRDYCNTILIVDRNQKKFPAERVTP